MFKTILETVCRFERFTFFPFQISVDLADQERISHQASADHDAVTLGLFSHFNKIIQRFDITIAKHRDMQSFFQYPDMLPVAVSFIHL